MDGMFTPDFFFKIIGVCAGIVLLVYANKFSLSALANDYQNTKTDIKNDLEEIQKSVDNLKVNQIKNCNDIKHHASIIDKIEERCYDRHAK
jgi:hypothetical protein